MIDDNDRREINEALADALGTSRPDAASVQRFISAVDAADRAGRTWPDDLREEVLRQWAFVQQKQLAKQASRVLIDYKGRRISKATRVGNRVSAEDGSVHYQQELITSMTWDEIDNWAQRIASQIDSLQANLAMVARLRQLQAQFPQSAGPAEAVKSLGMTVEQWLAS